jgi:hypothetical protein
MLLFINHSKKHTMANNVNLNALRMHVAAKPPPVRSLMILFCTNNLLHETNSAS